MASSLIQVRVDEKIKQETEEIFNNLGLNMSSAIRLFLNRVIVAQGLPFPMQLQTETMNEENYKISKEDDKERFNLEKIY